MKAFFNFLKSFIVGLLIFLIILYAYSLIIALVLYFAQRLFNMSIHYQVLVAFSAYLLILLSFIKTGVDSITKKN